MDDRQVLQLFPPAPPDTAPVQLSFASIHSARNIVLLGDPGAGKTHLFKSAATTVNGRYMTVRSFLNTPPNWGEATLFIDALDEKRSGRNDDSVVDAIVQKLFICPPAKVRVLCRAREWLAESDLEAFRTYFDENGGVTVVGISPLTTQEQRAVLIEHGITPSEIVGFLEDVDEHGLGGFKNNPQNLKMLAASVMSEWPATRADLFRESTRLWLPFHLPAGNIK